LTTPFVFVTWWPRLLVCILSLISLTSHTASSMSVALLPGQARSLGGSRARLNSSGNNNRQLVPSVPVRERGEGVLFTTSKAVIPRWPWLRRPLLVGGPGSSPTDGPRWTHQRDRLEPTAMPGFLASGRCQSAAFPSVLSLAATSCEAVVLHPTTCHGLRAANRHVNTLFRWIIPRQTSRGYSLVCSPSASASPIPSRHVQPSRSQCCTMWSWKYFSTG